MIALWLARQFLRNKDAARLELDGFGHGCQGIGIIRDKGDMGLAAPVYPFVPTQNGAADFLVGIQQQSEKFLSLTSAVTAQRSDVIS